MKYRYRLFCPDCTNIDFEGCFDGGTEDSEVAYETPQEAANAGYKEIQRSIWYFKVIDEHGEFVEETQYI